MTDTLKAHTITNHQVFRSMKGDPAIVRIDDGGTLDTTTTHRVAHEMKWIGYRPKTPSLPKCANRA